MARLVPPADVLPATAFVGVVLGAWSLVGKIAPLYVVCCLLVAGAISTGVALRVRAPAAPRVAGGALLAVALTVAGLLVPGWRTVPQAASPVWRIELPAGRDDVRVIPHGNVVWLRDATSVRAIDSKSGRTLGHADVELNPAVLATPSGLIGRVPASGTATRELRQYRPDGSLAWRFPAKGRTLEVRAAGPDTVVLSGCPRRRSHRDRRPCTLTGLDPRDGSSRWTRQVPVEHGADVPASSPGPATTLTSHEGHHWVFLDPTNGRMLGRIEDARVTDPWTYGADVVFEHELAEGCELVTYRGGSERARTKAPGGACAAERFVQSPTVASYSEKYVFRLPAATLGRTGQHPSSDQWACFCGDTAVARHLGDTSSSVYGTDTRTGKRRWTLAVPHGTVEAGEESGPVAVLTEQPEPAGGKDFRPGATLVTLHDPRTGSTTGRAQVPENQAPQQVSSVDGGLLMRYDGALVYLARRR